MSIENIRNNILNNSYADYKSKILLIKKNNKNIYIPDDKVNSLAQDLQKLNYVNLLVNGYSNKNTINTKGFLKKITNEINTVTKFNYTTLDTFNLMKESIKYNKEYKKLNKNKQFKGNLISMKGGFLGWTEETTTVDKALDVLTILLDIAGIVPAAGIAFDGINILINLLRKKFIMAGIGLISLVPIVGTIGPVLKVGYKMFTRKTDENKAKAKSKDKEEEDEYYEDEDEYYDDEDYDEDDDE